MSHAPKRFDTVPAVTVAAVRAYEGLVREALDQVTDALRECLAGSTNPYHWVQLERWTERLDQRHRALMTAIRHLQRAQTRV